MPACWQGCSAGQRDTCNFDPPLHWWSVRANQVDPQPTWPSRSFCPFKTLKQELVHPKDPVAVSKRKGVIYSIPCVECPCGLRDHWTCACKNIRSRALKKGNVTGSAVAEHAFEAGHQVDLSKASVIDYHRHTQTRCLLESWLIQHHQAPLNREKGIMPRLYATLLD